MIKKFSKYNPNKSINKKKYKNLLKVKIHWQTLNSIKVSAKEVELELIRSREDITRINQKVNYYHGNIDRNAAEKLLKEFYQINGKKYPI
jgi:hypothetical protein